MLKGVGTTAGWVESGWIANGGCSTTAFGRAGVAVGATAVTLNGHCLQVYLQK